MKAGLRTASVLALVVAAVALSGCQTTGGATSSRSMSSDDRIAGAMASAARDAATSGLLAESLAINQKLYNDDPNNADRILAYARDLRRAGRIDDAKLVIRTPALGGNASEPMLTECALTLVAEGSYEDAVAFAEKAIAKNAKSPDAHQALALAKSGTGDHAGAESAFAKALALWPQGRDQTAVINNLAMSQAAQGHVAQARATMTMATGEALKSEIYQNNRAFLSSLRDIPDTPKVAGIDVVDVTPSEQMAAEDSDAAMIMAPAQKPVQPKAGKLAAVEPVPQIEPVPVQAVEKAEIQALRGPSQKAAATPVEASINPAAGGAAGPTPLFDGSETPRRVAAAGKKNWWNMGFTPNDETQSRRGLNK